ncbi:MAG: inositol-3-phosphate synthase, partial [Firmicutes bacterium]|nr:inositol-3-phosphate synthase [Bacillota bacterium]
MSIKVALAGVGNCASSLVQGIEFYRKQSDARGLLHREIAGYGPGDIEIVAAFDVDRRKVGKKLREALLSKPNCTTIFCKELSDLPVVVQMGPVLDGVSEHVKEHDDDSSFTVADKEPCDVVEVLRSSGADMLINFTPVGSEKAARYYA